MLVVFGLTGLSAIVAALDSGKEWLPSWIGPVAAGLVLAVLCFLRAYRLQSSLDGDQPFKVRLLYPGQGTRLTRGTSAGLSDPLPQVLIEVSAVRDVADVRVRVEQLRFWDRAAFRSQDDFLPIPLMWESRADHPEQLTLRPGVAEPFRLAYVPPSDPQGWRIGSGDAYSGYDDLLLDTWYSIDVVLSGDGAVQRFEYAVTRADRAVPPGSILARLKTAELMRHLSGASRLRA